MRQSFFTFAVDERGSNLVQIIPRMKSCRKNSLNKLSWANDFGYDMAASIKGTLIS